jgi:hypothetical protein
MSFKSCFARLSIAACFGVLMQLSAAEIPRSGQEATCVVEDIDTPTMPACVVQSRDNSFYIPKKYWLHASFNRYGLSGFWIQSFGRVYINRSGRIVIRDVAFMDNGLDDFHHGLVRINRDGMWGYADPSGRNVVPVKYSCALNFKDKYDDIGPLVCVGCRIEQQGDYQACVEGTWFHVDRHGNLAPSPHPLSAKPRTP